MMTRIVTASLAVLLVAGEAWARGLLATPTHAFADARIFCLIANVSSRNVAGRIEVFAQGAAVISETPFTLIPGQRTSVNELGGVFCVFHMDEGSKAHVRAVAHIVDEATGTTHLVPAT